MQAGVGRSGADEPALAEERDQWLRAVWARLNRVSTTQDLSPVLEEDALTEARELERTLTTGPESLSALYLLGWLRWYQFQAAPEGVGEQNLQQSVSMLTDCFTSGMEPLPEPLVPMLADQAAPYAADLLDQARSTADEEQLSVVTDLWRRIVAATPDNHPDRAFYHFKLWTGLWTSFDRTGVRADLDEGVAALREAVEATPDDHPNYALYWFSLGLALWTRSEFPGEQADLDHAVQALQQSVRATPDDHADYAVRISNLRLALQARLERTGAQADLDGIVEIARQLVDATPDEHADRAFDQSVLGQALLSRFKRTGAQADVNDAIQAFRQAVEFTSDDDPNYGSHQSNLGIALRNRFERTGAPADLDQAIQPGQQAVQAVSDDHPQGAVYRSNLGLALQARFGHTGVQADLDHAIQAFSEAVHGTADDQPNRASYLSNFGGALLSRFKRTGAQADLDHAIAAARQAVDATPDDHPSRPRCLSNYGSALQARFERTGVQADLDHAIDAGQQAVDATPDNHPSRAVYLSNLGLALRVRFDRTGVQADLDHAIDTGQQAVDATPGEHPDQAISLSNLGVALWRRFDRTGTQADLSHAIRALQQAVQATPDDHPNRALFLSNLAIALHSRFNRTGADADLDNAIEASQRAIAAAPDDYRNRGRHQSILGSALLTRFRRTEAPADLDHAIEVARQALDATPDDHPDRASYLSNLGRALLVRFILAEAEADLNQAIQAVQEAVQATPDNDPASAAYLSGLGVALRTRFQHTGAAEDRTAAVQAYDRAASIDVAPASARIGAAIAGASLLAKADPGRAAGMLEAAVLLLPEVAPMLLERDDQQYAIGQFPGLAADAAALALTDPAVPGPQRPARALRLLEAARGILLSQALSTRGDLSQLRERHPELAERFSELRDWLDRPAPAAGPDLENLPGGEFLDTGQRAIQDRRQAAAEFTRLLARIRALEDFATFGLPPSAGQLEAQAQLGPVVVLNVSDYWSDAILLTRAGITSQPLPGLDRETVLAQVNDFYGALTVIATAVSPLRRAGAQEVIRRVLSWLWDNAAGPILDALGYRDQPRDGEPWPRLWWVPGGLLALLPFHAAGHHADPPDPGHRTVMDRVISSYTPTVGALAHARTQRPAATPGAAPQSLIVAMPTTPHLPAEARLVYVRAEANLLQRRLPNPTVLIEPPPAAATTDDGQLPTRAAVLQRLPDCAIAHFACHGSTDPADPSQNRLLLHDHRTSPLTVAALAPVVLEHAQLCYLSACSTARLTDDRLPDEAIHLATAFQLAGFPHVIGTLWEIDDAIAVEIADAFYTALVGPDGALDPSHAASAIHQAARALRDRFPAAPYLWASHIHAGALRPSRQTVREASAPSG